MADLKNISCKGFTLVEMAIVLVIVGLLVGLGSAMIGPLTNMAKLRETREVIDSDMTAVIGWAASNNRVPNGYTEFLTVTSKPNDAWGNAAYYFYDTSLPLSPGNVCGRKTTNLTICRNAACAAADRITNVAYTVISGGANFNPQTGIIACPTGVNGTCISVYDNAPSVDNCTTVTNCPAANVSSTFNRKTQVEEYDDIVRWVTLDELRSKIGCQGAQLKIVNNELSYGSLSSPYPDVYIVGDGGLGSASYQWCIENTAGTAPAGLSCHQNTATGTAFTTFSTGCLALPTWGTATQLVVNGTPTTGGSHFFKIFVRDGATTAANNTNKSFVLTVNP